MSSGPYLKVADLAREARVAPKTIYRHIDKGALRIFRLPGGDVRIHRDDAAAYLGTPGHAPQRESAAIAGVYFLQCLSWVKIGGSGDIKQRLEGLRTAIPLPVRPIGIIVVDGDWRRLERDLHRRFHAHRHHAEWFSLRDDLAAFVREHTSRPPWSLAEDN